MTFIDYGTCEPLRIWNRLEPRAREVEFDGALEARVHDGLWMLARQWQMGEFQGEDAGSAVLARIAQRVTPVAATAVGTGALAPDDGSLPVEARVERLPVEVPPLVRARLGRRFAALLTEAGGTTAHVAAFRTDFPIAPPAEPSGDVARAQARVDGRARRTAAALAGRAIDGVALNAKLHAGVLPADLGPNVALAVDGPTETAAVLAAVEAYRVWYDDLYPAPADGWDGAALEYRARCTIPRDTGTLELTVDEHTSGRLDWSAYDQGTVMPGPTAHTTTEVRTVMPTPATFPGMPNPRWWQFEDAAVDLAGFSADATDLAKLVVAEFALVYGNNWLVIPSSQPVGSLSEIDGIVVTDTFGRRELVRAAAGASGGRWTAWDLFSLSPRGTGAGVPPPLGEHLFLPPTLGHVADGEALESVALVRDESANLVWAIEQRVPDGLGASQDGTAAARRLTDEIVAADPAPQPAGLHYRLGTEVPPNWIPFVPVHIPDSTREIRLQRAAIPWLLAGSTDPIRPRTSILSAQPRYFVNEEEVPRAGVRVEGRLRRARWTDGRTVVWHGRTVFSGRGETDSGLRFDVLETPDGGTHER